MAWNQNTKSNSAGLHFKYSPSSSQCSDVRREDNRDQNLPDIVEMFHDYNTKYFGNRLKDVSVEWSKKLFSCAGMCSCYPECIVIRLSQPILKLRSHSEVTDVLLHEMIHAYLFHLYPSTAANGHDDNFIYHMNRINSKAGTNIEISHKFYDEVKQHKKHIWVCDGPCQNLPPRYGVVARARNRHPRNDFWFPEHEKTCGGTFKKVSADLCCRFETLSVSSTPDRSDEESISVLKSPFEKFTSSLLNFNSLMKEGLNQFSSNQRVSTIPQSVQWTDNTYQLKEGTEVSRRPNNGDLKPQSERSFINGLWDVPHHFTSAERFQKNPVRQNSSTENSITTHPAGDCYRSSVDHRNGLRETPLHLAAVKGDLNPVKSLLDRRADPNVPEFAVNADSFAMGFNKKLVVSMDTRKGGKKPQTEEGFWEVF